MLLTEYNQQGLLFITSVLGPTDNKNIEAFRGDLIIKQGAFREGSTTDRKPPELLLHQAAVLADSEKFIFVSGLFYHLEEVTAFIEKYGDVLKPETVTLIFVENIAANMKVEINGVSFNFLPYKEGMIWNDSMELLYIEKSELKGLSAEEKVVTVFEAAKGFKFKADTLSLDEALTKTIVVKKMAAVGPV